MSGEARRRLARAQATVVKALVSGGPVPAGFEPRKFKAAARALAEKRTRHGMRSPPRKHGRR